MQVSASRLMLLIICIIYKNSHVMIQIYAYTLVQRHLTDFSGSFFLRFWELDSDSDFEGCASNK